MLLQGMKKGVDAAAINSVTSYPSWHFFAAWSLNLLLLVKLMARISKRIIQMETRIVV